MVQVEVLLKSLCVIGAKFVHKLQGGGIEAELGVICVVEGGARVGDLGNEKCGGYAGTTGTCERQ